MIEIKRSTIVLEVNGIPAFATPAQEKMGLDFNDKKHRFDCQYDR